MGDLVQTSKDEYSGWTGGKPKSDWSGLDPKASTEFESPNQLHPMYAKAQMDAYNGRRAGLETKFDAKDDLAVFEEEVWKHLLDSGLDTIAYLPDIEDILGHAAVQLRLVRQVQRLRCQAVPSQLAESGVEG